MSTAWENWCALRGEQSIPASPMIVARFVADIAPLGIDRVWQAVLEISRSHYTIGLPCPCSGPGAVTDAVNAIAKIPPPRSWSTPEKQRFLTLPYDIQLTISNRERDRDNQIRTMQNEFAKLKKESEHASTTSTGRGADVAAA